jgi:hypothetical protein
MVMAVRAKADMSAGNAIPDLNLLWALRLKTHNMKR